MREVTLRTGNSLVRHRRWATPRIALKSGFLYLRPEVISAQRGPGFGWFTVIRNRSRWYVEVQLFRER